MGLFNRPIKKKHKLKKLPKYLMFHSRKSTAYPHFPCIFINWKKEKFSKLYSKLLNPDAVLTFEQNMVICQSKIRYFAQPRPIIDKYRGSPRGVHVPLFPSKIGLCSLVPTIFTQLFPTLPI